MVTVAMEEGDCRSAASQATGDGSLHCSRDAGHPCPLRRMLLGARDVTPAQACTAPHPHGAPYGVHLCRTAASGDLTRRGSRQCEALLPANSRQRAAIQTPA
jgi:hypothetical protein